MTDITFLLFMIIFIVLLWILDGIIHLALFSMLMFFLAGTFKTIFTIPTGAENFYLIMIMFLALCGLWKIVYLAQKDKQQFGRIFIFEKE